MKFNPAAIVFLRGGSDSTIGIWNQPTIIKMLLALTCPCYLALGHERFISAADQIADQSFSTPTDFGNSLGKAMRDRAVEIAKNKHIEQLTMEIGDVRESVVSMETLNTKLTGDLQLASQELVKLRSSLTLWKFAAIAVGASLALVVLLPQIKSYL